MFNAIRFYMIIIITTYFSVPNYYINYYPMIQLTYIINFDNLMLELKAQQKRNFGKNQNSSNSRETVPLNEYL